jgi:hypothetical protein
MHQNRIHRPRSGMSRAIRPVLICEGVDRLTLDDFSFPRVAQVSKPIVLKNVGHVERRRTENDTEK